VNIFYTNENPERAADELCDIHLTKMLMEAAQLMSCCHRRLDGFGPLWVKHNGNDRKWWVHHTDALDSSGRRIQLMGYVMLAGVNMEDSALDWLCEGRENYTWLFRCWKRMLGNFERNRGKPHEYAKLYDVLFDFPEALPEGGTPHPKVVYPEFRDILPTTAAYQAHINHKMTLPAFRTAQFETVTPDWLTKVPLWPAITKEEMVAAYGGSKKAVPSFRVPGAVPTEADFAICNSIPANIVHAADAKRHNDEIIAKKEGVSELLKRLESKSGKPTSVPKFKVPGE